MMEQALINRWRKNCWDVGKDGVQRRAGAVWEVARERCEHGLLSPKDRPI